MPLSDTRIRAAKPQERPYKLSDSGGLHLDVRPTGARLWRYRYRLAGQENTFAIGEYPDISLAEAREARDAARKLVRDGIHPAHQRKVEKLKAQFEGKNTFETVAREWLEDRRTHKDAPWAVRTYRQRKGILEKEFFPTLGSLPLSQVTPAHVYPILKKLEKRAPQMAVVARQCASAISQLGIATGRATTDLGYPLRKAVKTKSTVHKRPMREQEIPAFFEVLDRYSGGLPVKIAIELLWWTLVRPIEVIGANWDEFDLANATWTIPAHRMKMAQPHVVPLPKQAVARLKALRPLYGKSAFLLPNRKDSRKPASPGIIAKAFVSMGYEGTFSPGAVRVTGRTMLGEQGHPKDVLERQIAHRDKKHVRAYDQGDRLEARRVVMQGWADYLDALKRGTQVLSFKVAKS